VPTVRDAVRDLMRAHGATTAFGAPGSTGLGLLRDWPDDLRHVLVPEEGAAVAMACGHAQLTGGPVVVGLHAAAGVGSAMGGVVAARHNRSPLVLVAGRPPRALLPGDPLLASLDPAALPRSWVKAAWEPACAADVPAAFARAVHTATQPPCGPVLVSVSADDWDREAAAVPPRPRVTRCAPDPDALAALADALRASTDPALVVGAAVDQDGAVADVVELARRAGASVWAAPASTRCSFPEDDPWFAGHLPAAPRQLAAALARHDLVVVLGAPALAHQADTPPGTAPPELHLLSDDEQVLAAAPRGVGIRTTMKLGIAQLNQMVRPSGRTAPVRRPSRGAPAPRGMTGALALHVLAGLLPPDALVVEEVPGHRDDLHEQLPITTRDAGFLTTGSGVPGYALPAAVGAALAVPRRPVVAVVGDGSLLRHPQALWTAARERVALVVLVLDDAGHGALRSPVAGVRDVPGGGVPGGGVMGGDVPGGGVSGVDVPALARSLGVAAVSASTRGALAKAVETALGARTTTLVHVPVSHAHEPRH
jgi:benzoylformate decarboxylase